MGLGDLIKQKLASKESIGFQQMGAVSNLLSGTNIVKKLLNQKRKKLELKYAFPANLKMAKRHTRAIKYGTHANQEGKKRILCPCCSLSINTEQLRLFKDNTSVLGKLDDFRVNSCVAFFFTFIKFLIITLILRILILDIFNFVTNLVDGDFCNEICSKQLWSLGSILHKYNREDLIHITNILVLVVCIVYIICFMVYRKFMYYMYDTIDQIHQTQDDFTIFVQNIPILNFPEGADQQGNFQFNYDQDLQNMMKTRIINWIGTLDDNKDVVGTIEKDYVDLLQSQQKQYHDPPQDIVKSITLCYDLSNLQKISKMRNQLVAKHENNVAQQKQGQLSNVDQRFDTIPEQIEFLNECQVSLSKSYVMEKNLVFKSTHFVGSAFISLKYQHYREHLVYLYNQNKNQFMLKDQALKIERASYPTDVMWKNIKIGDSQRTKRIMISYGILFAVILIAFFALVGSDRFQAFLLKLLKKDSENNSFLNINWGALAVGLVTTVITLGINTFLQFLAYTLTDWQKHQSMANAKSSLCAKLLITQFLNTAMIYLALSLIRDDDENALMSEQGLVYQISTLMVLSGFIQIFNNFINVPAIIRWLTIWWKYRGKSDDDEIPKFQVTLNRECENIEFDLAQKYCYYLLQLYMVSFYSYVMPIIVPAVAVIFFFQYWVDKYNLFKKSSLFYELQYSLTRYIMKMAEVSIFIFALGSFLFCLRVYKKADTVLIVAMSLTFLFIIMSILVPERIIKKIFWSNETCEKFQYDQCVNDGKFIETYWLNNPATRLIDQSSTTSRKNVRNYAAQYVTIKDKDQEQIDEEQEKKLNQAMRVWPI